MAFIFLYSFLLYEYIGKWFVRFYHLENKFLYLDEILLALTISFSLIQFIAAKKRFHRDPLILPLLGLLVWVILSSIWAGLAPWEIANYISTLLKPFFLFWVAIYLFYEESQYLNLLKFFLILGFVQMPMVIYQFQNFRGYTSPQDFRGGFLGFPAQRGGAHELGAFMALLAIYLIITWGRTTQYKYLRVFLIVAFATVIGLVDAKRVLATLAVTLSSLVIFRVFLRYKQKLIRWKHICLMMILLLIGIVIVFPSLSRYWHNNFGGRRTFWEYGRLNGFGYVLSLARSPFDVIFGLGPGNFLTVFSSKFGGRFEHLSKIQGDLTRQYGFDVRMRTDWINTLAELGIVGFVLRLLVFFQMFRISLFSKKKNYNIALLSMFCTLFYFFLGFFGHYYFTAVVGLPVMTIVAYTYTKTKSDEER